MGAEAYSVFQTFEAMPRAEFMSDRHYLLYSASGSLRLEAEGKMWALPPARAALIQAGSPVYVSIPVKVVACSVLFETKFMPPPPSVLSVFDMTTLARELVLHCSQWSDPNMPLDAYARQIFTALAHVVWKLAETPFKIVMPVPRSRSLIEALAMTETMMAGSPSFETIAERVAATPRSLARRFEDEMGMTWRQALRRLRMIRALEMLSDEPMSVTEIAFAVGYTSLSAFNAAFLEYVGHTPTAWRQTLKNERF